MIHPNLLRCLVILLISTAITACSIGQPATPYVIVAPMPEVRVDQALPAVNGTLLVQRPVADRTRDSDRILVRESGMRLRVYPASVWVDSVPEMVQTVMIRAFEDADRLDGVHRSGSGQSRFQLRTEIRRFEAVDDGGEGLDVDLAIRAGLFHVATSRMMAVHTFHQRVSADDASLDSLVHAFEDAMGRMVSDLVGWVIVEAAGAESDS